METLEEIKARLDAVGVRLFREEAPEEPPKIPTYARSLEGASPDGITQDDFWETSFKTDGYRYSLMDPWKRSRAIELQNRSSGMRKGNGRR